MTISRLQVVAPTKKILEEVTTKNLGHSRIFKNTAIGLKTMSIGLMGLSGAFFPDAAQ